MRANEQIRPDGEIQDLDQQEDHFHAGCHAGPSVPCMHEPVTQYRPVRRRAADHSRSDRFGIRYGPVNRTHAMRFRTHTMLFNRSAQLIARHPLPVRNLQATFQDTLSMVRLSVPRSLTIDIETDASHSRTVETRRNRR